VVGVERVLRVARREALLERLDLVAVLGGAGGQRGLGEAAVLEELAQVVGVVVAAEDMAVAEGVLVAERSPGDVLLRRVWRATRAGLRIVVIQRRRDSGNICARRSQQ